MPNDSDQRPVFVLRPPVLLQIAVLLAVALYAANVFRGWLYPSAATGGSPRQSIYVVGPKGGSLQELQTLLDSGCRVVAATTSRATVAAGNTTHVGLVLENDKREQQLAITHIDGQPAQDAVLKALDAKLKEGWRVTQLSAAAAPSGEEAGNVSVFVLEKYGP
jgi:hypothetical protein